MIVTVDPTSSVPLYRQLKTAQVAGILSGELSEGESLRSMRELAGELGINLHTVRKVYGILADEGYITISRNRGAIVNALPKMQTDELQSFREQLLPIVIELRARGIDRTSYDRLMGMLWDESVKEGVRDGS